jgi:hypothetical protein
MCLPCKHELHVACYKTLLEHHTERCPLCREDVQPGTPERDAHDHARVRERDASPSDSPSPSDDNPFARFLVVGQPLAPTPATRALLAVDDTLYRERSSAVESPTFEALLRALHDDG